MTRVDTSTPPNTPAPIGPYSHIAKVGQLITIGGTAGFDPATAQLAGPDVNVFLKDMRDFEDMNRAYAEMMGDHRPARTVIGVNELPKPGIRLTMNLTAVTKE